MSRADWIHFAALVFVGLVLGAFCTALVVSECGCAPRLEFFGHYESSGPACHCTSNPAQPDDGVKTFLDRLKGTR